MVNGIGCGRAAASEGGLPGGLLALGAAETDGGGPLAAVIGGAWWLSLVAGAALLTALVANEIYIWHDLALFAFEACWVVMGVLAYRRSGADRAVEPSRTRV